MKTNSIILPCSDSSQQGGDKPKYSHGRDYRIGHPLDNGMTGRDEPSDFSNKDKAETGLIVRQPL